MRVVLIIFLGGIFYTNILFSFSDKLPLLDCEKTVLLNTIEGKNCFISYISIDGKPFIIKQKKIIKKLIAVIRDALAAYIAEELAIAHHVDVISYETNCLGKVESGWPATIHTIAKGQTLKNQHDCMYNKLRLKQWWARMEIDKEQGLTRQIINHMSWHDQLPILVGLDLILGNSDRHGDNFFYDPETNNFCAIDMDNTFNKNLCKVAYGKLKAMVSDSYCVFTQKEINALRQLKNTITFLLDHYTARKIIKKMHYFAEKAGFVKGKPLYSDRIEKKLHHYELMIKQSLKSARKVIILLEKIINNNYKKFI